MPRHSLAGIDWLPVPYGPNSPDAAKFEPEELGPRPGWYAVSVNWVQHAHMDYFRRLKPVGRAGYSILIYHVTPEEAEQLWRELQRPRVGNAPIRATSNDFPLILTTFALKKKKNQGLPLDNRTEMGRESLLRLRLWQSDARHDLP